jgi:glutamate dehydrogenase/leucine dehydrogenase
MSDLYFRKVRYAGPVDVYEVYERRPVMLTEERYACVALCRHQRHLPAIGGTRGIAATREEIREIAVELARTMDDKVSLIRFAEHSRGNNPALFEWRGGKGVIMLPEGYQAPSPRLLLAYGRLVEHLGGEFFASIDANVGRSQLRWIERATSYVVGNSARRQTSESTAIGVHAGIHATLEAMDLPAERLRKRLGNVDIALFGLGKVGFSLLRMLYEEGAAIRVWEPRLRLGCDVHFEQALNNGAQIDTHDREILRRLESDNQLFKSEEEALANAFATGWRAIRIVCAAADEYRWLIRDVHGKPRYRHFAANPHDGPMIIIGATNDQLGATRDSAARSALTMLAAKKVVFVPDQIVSPGGVISVSWELAPIWQAEGVRRDTERVVSRNIEMLFDDAGGPTATALTIDAAFQRLLARARKV